ncbi:Cytochrome bo(3) ubiquinol oxidase subunit 2 [Buchnera aphidicola (Neophyllaphis podocarpi)]|uniref:ubiquinol oxidase subunit II n=1 Tax=Buchnera aphidicola TaxID=9 RepID=UPI00346484B4
MKFNNKFKYLILAVINFIFSGYNFKSSSSSGYVALEENNLILISLITMLLVVIPVIFMTFFFVFKYRESNIYAKYNPNWSFSSKIEIIIWIIPILIVLFLSSLSWFSSHKLDPRKELFYNTKPPIEIEVVSLDWRWLFIYPKYKIATINELVFPVNNEIKFNITSNSVMNSFFIPSLGSQIYSMPGMKTCLHLIANKPGKFNGFSANYSGRGFSNMNFAVKITNDNDKFLSWIKNIQHKNNYLNDYLFFKNISMPNEDYSIKYFSNVVPGLFNKIVNKFNK